MKESPNFNPLMSREATTTRLTQAKLLDTLAEQRGRLIDLGASYKLPPVKKSMIETAGSIPPEFDSPLIIYPGLSVRALMDIGKILLNDEIVSSSTIYNVDKTPRNPYVIWVGNQARNMSLVTEPFTTKTGQRVLYMPNAADFQNAQRPTETGLTMQEAMIYQIQSPEIFSNLIFSVRGSKYRGREQDVLFLNCLYDPVIDIENPGFRSIFMRTLTKYKTPQ